MWPSLSFLLLWLVVPHPSCTPIDASKQKASTRPPIHGALPGRWVSLVFLPCWATPPIWASIVPSPPLTLKTDWWALPSHFVLVFYYDTIMFLALFDKCIIEGFCLVVDLINLGVFAFKKRQPLPLSPQNYPLHGSEVNGAHPAGFHSGSSSFGVSSHTPPIAGTDTIMGKPFNVCYFLCKKWTLNIFMWCCHTVELLLSTSSDQMLCSPSSNKQIAEQYLGAQAMRLERPWHL